MSKKDTTYILNEIRNYLDEFNNASDDYYSFIKLSKELTELRTTIQRIELVDASIPYINQLKKQYDAKEQAYIALYKYIKHGLISSWYETNKIIKDIGKISDADLSSKNKQMQYLNHYKTLLQENNNIIKPTLKERIAYSLSNLIRKRWKHE